jgi:phosphate transport system substrate-binding protein
MKTTTRPPRCAPMKTNRWLRLGLILLCAIFVASCSRKTEVIVIRGSNTFGEELAPRLIAEFRKDHPEVTFDTEFKGTTYGLGALMVDRCDIAAASRDLTTNELALAKDRDVDFNNYAIGTYSVAVVVNANNAVGSLMKEQVRDIFTGAVQNWKEVGGPDAPIHLYIRDPISGTYLGFRELAMDNKNYAIQVKTLTNYTDLVQAIARDPGGIGYSSIELSTQAGIRPVFIGGVPPTATLVNKGQYPYARMLRLHTHKSKEKSAAGEFIKFVQSERGQKILDEMGCVPRS